MNRHRYNLHVKPLRNEGARKAEEEALAVGRVTEEEEEEEETIMCKN